MSARNDELISNKLKQSNDQLLSQNSHKSMITGNNGEGLYQIYGAGKNLKHKFKAHDKDRRLQSNITESLTKKR